MKWCLYYAAHQPNNMSYTDSAAPATPSRILDCSKLERLLGERKPLGVERGIRDTIEWYQQHHATWNR